MLIVASDSNPAVIQLLIEAMAHTNTKIATLCLDLLTDISRSKIKSRIEAESAKLSARLRYVLINSKIQLRAAALNLVQALYDLLGESTFMELIDIKSMPTQLHGLILKCFTPHPNNALLVSEAQNAIAEIEEDESLFLESNGIGKSSLVEDDLGLRARDESPSLDYESTAEAEKFSPSLGVSCIVRSKLISLRPLRTLQVSDVQAIQILQEALDEAALELGTAGSW